MPRSDSWQGSGHLFVFGAGLRVGSMAGEEDRDWRRQMGAQPGGDMQ